MCGKRRVERLPPRSRIARARRRHHERRVTEPLPRPESPLRPRRREPINQARRPTQLPPGSAPYRAHAGPVPDVCGAGTGRVPGGCGPRARSVRGPPPPGWRPASPTVRGPRPPARTPIPSSGRSQKGAVLIVADRSQSDAASSPQAPDASEQSRQLSYRSDRPAAAAAPHPPRR